MTDKRAFATCVTFSCMLLMTFPPAAEKGWAVSSKITRQTTSADFLAGETSGVVIGSRGTIQLGRASEVLVEKFEDVWSINSIVVSGGTVYLGSSPNGGIYKYSLGKLTKIYPLSAGRLTAEPDTTEDDSASSASEGKPTDANTVEVEQYLANEHIFAMATDVAGRLLVGISGEKCKLCRLEADKMETIFEPNDVEGTKYIFAITTDEAGNIYLGTGPQGKIYQLDPLGKEAQLVYDSLDKNILSLAIGQDGFIYAGSDSRGLVYKIDPRSKTATVLYDSEQPEITALLSTGTRSSEDRDLYAAATSAKIVQSETKFAAIPAAGRPETVGSRRAATPSQRSESASKGVRKLQIANTKEPADNQSAKRKAPPRPPAKPAKASYIYKITKDGFVTDIFSETAVFFCLAESAEGGLLVGTGNDAQLFAVDPASEQETIIYEDEQASQITAVAVSADVVYVGTANPAKLIKLQQNYAGEGTYISAPLDAGQPAKWGKLQIEADIPEGCKVLLASRSGNVKDVNDPTFSDWTELVEVTEPIQLRCPLGRFCQYKLLLQSKDGLQSPLIREVAVASTVPNLAPKVESVSVSRIKQGSKTGIFKISYKAKDDNNDKLIYKIDFRKIGRTTWIELKDELQTNTFEWDGKTVEDGRYEVRVIASDERSNTTTTKLTGSRISDPVVVDNTGPIIKKHSIEKNDKTITLKLQVYDELSAIGQLHYTIDSNAEWKGALPDDLVYDTTEENFTIVIEELETGEHILALRISDDIGNTTYKTFELNS
ncbi:MAG: hypothetical protein ACE5NM_03115 [Sedimentisphaerales bacterium]